jgi:hypothetical protein
MAEQRPGHHAELVGAVELTDGRGKRSKGLIEQQARFCLPPAALTERLPANALTADRAPLLGQAPTLRSGGAMNSGPTGSWMVSRRMRSISAMVEASSAQPVTSSTGCNWSG